VQQLPFFIDEIVPEVDDDTSEREVKETTPKTTPKKKTAAKQKTKKGSQPSTDHGDRKRDSTNGGDDDNHNDDLELKTQNVGPTTEAEELKFFRHLIGLEMKPNGQANHIFIVYWHGRLLARAKVET
jgi:hypothetical protein